MKVSFLIFCVGVLRIHQVISIVALAAALSSCENKGAEKPLRPQDPWVFRSVLDKKPRMLTIALDSQCYAAYDLERCILYKVWKGGVMMEGTAYTNKKNVQPTSWGASYYADTLGNFRWVAERDGKAVSATVVSKGYRLADNRITLKYRLILSTKDTITIEEHPDCIRRGEKFVFERSFKIAGVPDDILISLQSDNARFKLRSDQTNNLISEFDPLPRQFPPDMQAEYDHRGWYWLEKSDCNTCHEYDKKTVGPSFLQIAQRYKDREGAITNLIAKVKEGGSGAWGNTAMNAHPNLTDREIKTMLDYILSLQPDEDDDDDAGDVEKNEVPEYKPGFGAPLETVHPSYDLATLHDKGFQPRVGGLAFLPDGRLLVTTWDAIGGVYLLSNVATGDTNKIEVKRIAFGLAEPLGIEVVNGEIFVLQKQELTQLIDLDGDEIIDEYRAICNSWGVSADFHEFAFGLVHQDGYFYATLSMAMRLMSHERQKPDRGKTIRIAMDGSYAWVNYGLRTPNGIGIGVDEQIFVTENQGEWVPSNKLIHVAQGEYHGMPWALADPTGKQQPTVALPALWLPEDEIANSPSEPILMRDGPYKGQMLHGDVTHGGIKRDFIEKINGRYQGAVFRFTQGLAAGVNRLEWGPDGALYIGGIGMVGGWSWKEKKFGLQRMKYNGKTTFEMLAVRAKANGFEIEFTEPLDEKRTIKPADILIQQWWYRPTNNYGGPKMDLEKLSIRKIILSADKTRAHLEIPGLKKEHVVYIRLPENLQSARGQSLWSSEVWYTLNNTPQ